MRTINKYSKPGYAVDVWSNHVKVLVLETFSGLLTVKEEMFHI
jgi:penicillin-binding protein 2